MRGTELLEKMELIDPKYIEAAEETPMPKSKTWIKWATVAACFCLIVVISATMKVPPANKTIFNYNKVSISADKERLNIEGYFTKELSKQEIIAILPNIELPYAVTSATAGFDGSGRLMDITLDFSENNAEIVMSPVQIVLDYLPLDAPVTTSCNGVDYTVVEDGTTLQATAKISDVYFLFSMEGKEIKDDFEKILECFTHYDNGKPNISVIKTDVIPEWFNKALSLSEAQTNPDFGKYMLKNIPNGFKTESIRRYKDQNFNYLSGLWTRVYDELFWKISYFGQEDECRLTSVNNKENYDLSLYPIPRADSVPQELTAIVDNPIFSAEELTFETVSARAYTVDDVGDSQGVRMHFSVKYGNVIVEIRAKGVDPQWIYEQLMSLCD